MRAKKHKSFIAFEREQMRFVLLYKRVLMGRVGRKKQCEKALIIMHQL